MINFICKNCNFKFKAKRASSCPYCDKQDVEREKSAEDLLEEAENL